MSDRARGSLGSLELSGDRTIHGASLFLLEGGVEVDAMRAEPVGGWPTIGVYGWASHDVDPMNPSTRIGITC